MFWNWGCSVLSLRGRTRVRWLRVPVYSLRKMLRGGTAEALHGRGIRRIHVLCRRHCMCQEKRYFTFILLLSLLFLYFWHSYIICIHTSIKWLSRWAIINCIDKLVCSLNFELDNIYSNVIWKIYLSFVWSWVLSLSSFTVVVDLSKPMTCLHFHSLIYSKY